MLGACSHPPSASPSTASTRSRSRSRRTSCATCAPAFTIVGLPDASVREARDRVRSGLETREFELPRTASSSTSRRPTVRKDRRRLRPRDRARHPGRRRRRCPARRAARGRRARRARARRHACGPVRGAARGRAGARGRPRAASSCRPSRAPEAALVDGVEPIRVRTSSSTPSRSCRRAATVRPVPPAGAAAAARDVARPGRRARPAARPARARDRRRRRPQPAAGRPAGHRQVDAGAAAAGHAAAADARRGARDRRGSSPSPAAQPATGWSTSGRSARRTTRPRAPALVGGGAEAAARRDLARPPRRAVPRRAAGVPARRARGAARAARGRARRRSPAPRGSVAFPAALRWSRR